MHPKLIVASEPTIRIWLLLVVLASKGEPVVTTATALAEMMSPYRKTSNRSASQAIRDLEGLGLIRVRRVGRASEISMGGLREKAAA